MKESKKYISIIFILLSFIGILTGISSLTYSYFSFISDTKKQQVFRPSALNKNILFISSYTESYPYTREQLYGINTIFSRYNIPYDTIYMDMKVHNTHENVRLFHEHLKYKLANHQPYKAVIVADDPALEFVMKEYDNLFSGIPVVFMGVNDEDLAAEASRNPFFTGSTETLCLEDFFKIVTKLFPEAKTIAAVYDDRTQATIGFRKQFFKYIEHAPFEFIGLHSSTMSKNELIRRLKALPSDAVVLNLGFYNDLEGHKYSLPEMTSLIVQNSYVPCFSVVLESVGAGFLGGAVFDTVAAAAYTAETVVRILDGADVARIPLKMDIPSQIIFDWNIMKRFHIKKAQIPREAIIINAPVHYFSEYSFILYPSIMIFISMVVLLGILFSYTLDIKKIQKQLEFRLSHNSLTNLPNRPAAVAYLSRLIAEKRRFSIISLDIEDFKAVNDYYSHSFGDRLLIELSRRLESLSEIGDWSSYRFTSDEFTVILTDGHIQETSLELYYLRQLLSSPFCADENPIFIKTSIGIINSDESRVGADAYFIDADIAMYEAKRRGTNKTAIFTPEMRRDIEERHNIVHDVEFACRNDGFFVMFQPQITTDTNEIFGFEALCRLKVLDEDGTSRIVPPTDFIPVAEKSGYISKIGRIVTDKTIRAMVEWRRKGLELHKVSINFSAAQISDSGYVNYLSELLHENGIDPKYICIEITESLFLGNRKQATELFDQFKELGVQLALDDFGTGYSSLSYLAYLPVDIVKIDKSLVDMYLSNPEKENFVENIVNLVHSLDMKLVVEGVEERWQYDKIKEFGGDYIQGYFFSKPILADDVEQFRPVLGE